MFHFNIFRIKSLEKWKKPKAAAPWINASKKKQKFYFAQLDSKPPLQQVKQDKSIISILLHSADITGCAMPKNTKLHFHQRFTMIHWLLPLDAVYCSSDFFFLEKLYPF